MYGETWFLETAQADGIRNRLIFNDPWALPERTNLGQPVSEWLVRDTYDSAGQHVIGYNLQSRQIALNVIHSEAQTTDEFYAVIDEIHDVLRSNRHAETYLVIVKADGSLRAISIRPDPGFELGSFGNDDYHLSETIGVIAHSPLFFNPIRKSIRLRYVSEVVSPTPEIFDELAYPAESDVPETIRYTETTVDIDIPDSVMILPTRHYLRWKGQRIRSFGDLVRGKRL